MDIRKIKDFLMQFLKTLIISLFFLNYSLALAEEKNEVVSLHGIILLKPDAICFNENKRPWACGKLATKTLKSLTTQNGVKCTKVLVSAINKNTLLCRNKHFVVNSVLVGLGLAIPITEGKYYVANQLRAQRERRGVWRSGKEWVATNQDRLFSVRFVSVPQA